MERTTLKLAIVADELDPTNGWGRYAGELARCLIKSGVDVRLVAPPSDAVPADLRIHPDQAELPSFRRGTPHFARLLARSFRPLRRALADVDAIHCMVEPYAPAVALAAGSRPVCISLVGTYAVPSGRDWMEARMLRWAMRRASRLVAISRYTEQRVRQDTGFDHTSVVPLAVRAEEFVGPEPPIIREPALVLSVGEPKPRKGYDTALEAFANVHARLPGSRYVIVGGFSQTSPFVRRLLSRIEELRLRDSVTLIGAVSHEELVSWYRRSSVVVMPYQSVGRDFEGFGLVLLEAGACGAPVISTYGSPAEEIVIDDESGLLVPPGDVAALSAAVERLIKMPEEHQRLASGSRQRALEMTWDRSTAQLLEVYRQVWGCNIRSWP